MYLYSKKIQIWQSGSIIYVIKFINLGSIYPIFYKIFFFLKRENVSQTLFNLHHFNLFKLWYFDPPFESVNICELTDIFEVRMNT